jgi:hypothetical protein
MISCILQKSKLESDIDLTQKIFVEESHCIEFLTEAYSATNNCIMYSAVATMSYWLLKSAI